MTRRSRRPAPVLLLAALATLSACAAPEGRIKSDDEGDLVGARAAGSAVYRQQVEEVVQKMLSGHAAEHPGLTKATVAVLGIDSQGIEPLGDWGEQLYDLINGSVNNSNVYRTISRRFVDRALREGNMRPDDLFLPRYQREFVSILETQGSPVDILVFPKMSTGSTQGSGGVSQRDYLMTLELVDIDTGYDEVHQARVSKEYAR